MKKVIALLLVIAIAVGVLCCFSGCSGVKTESKDCKSQDGNWNYRIETSTVTVKSESEMQRYVEEGYEVESKDGSKYNLKRVWCYLSSYNGDDTDLVIPAYVDDIKVNALDAGIFVKLDESNGRSRGTYTNNTQLKTVRIEAEVLEVPARAFYMCSALTDIEFPATCKKIGDFAFYGCTSLASIVIPASIKDIGGYTFRECANLKDVYILNEDTDVLPPKIGEKTFYMVNSKLSSDDQYYIIPGLKIHVNNIAVFNKDVIDADRKANHTNDYKYWLDYIPDYVVEIGEEA